MEKHLEMHTGTEMCPPRFPHADPALWSTDHVTQWLQWCVKEFGVHDIDTTKFRHMDGKKLCQLTREDFNHLTTTYTGEVLLAHLSFLQCKFI